MKKAMSLLVMLLIGLLTISTSLSFAQDITPVPVVTSPAVAPIASPTGFTIHDISGNYTLLVNMTTGKLFSAPSIDGTVATTLDEVVKFNIKVAFPTNSTASTSTATTDTTAVTPPINRTILGGPFVGVNLVKLISKSPKIKITTGVNLEAGGGVLFDVLHISGLGIKDLKSITFPGIALGVSL